MLYRNIRYLNIYYNRELFLQGNSVTPVLIGSRNKWTQIKQLHVSPVLYGTYTSGESFIYSGSIEWERQLIFWRSFFLSKVYKKTDVPILGYNDFFRIKILLEKWSKVSI
jgi:hypothetical protein